MSSLTTGDLKLVKPATTDNISQTIDVDLPANFDKIDEAVSNKVVKVTGSRLVSETEIANFNDKYTKLEVDNKISSVYRFKGSVATYANLPTTGQVEGDVYNVTNTGINYAWATGWDDIGGVEALATLMNDGLLRKEDFAKLQGISANAKNVASSITNGNIKIDNVETPVYSDTEIRGQINSVVSEMADIATENLKNEASNLITPSLMTGYLKRIEGYDNILSMPSNANGQVYPSINGLTASQMIPNGNFKNGVTGVTGFTCSGGTISVSDGIATAIGNGLNTSIAVSPATLASLRIFPLNTKWYMKARMRSLNSECITLRYRAFSGGKDINVINPVVNQWYEFSDIAVNPYTVQVYPMSVYAIYADAATQNEKSLQIEFMMAIDLGVDASNPDYNLTKAQLESKYSNYFEGTKSTLSQNRFVSKGKNIWGSKKMADDVIAKVGNSLYAYLSSIDGRDCLVLKGAGVLANKEIFKKFKPLTQYTISAYARNETAETGGLFVIRYTDGSYEMFDAIGTSWIKRVKVTAINKTVKCIELSYGSGVNSFYDYNTFQIVEGTVEVPYVSYKESIKYTPNVGTLGSVPLIADKEFRDTDGKQKKVQNTREYILKASDIEAFYAGTIVDFCTVSTTLMTGIKPITTYFVDGTIRVAGFKEVTGTTAEWDNAAHLNGFGKSSSVGGKIQIFVAHNAYANLAAIQAALAGIKIQYKLATPIITELQCVGELEVYPKGSIDVEPTHWGYATSTVTVVTTTDLPIKAIRKVECSELSVTGKLIKTDVTANCTFTETTLTIGSYDANKVYFYDCEIDSQYSMNGYKVLDVEVDNGIATHDYLASVTDWVLSDNEGKATMLVCTNAGGAAKIIAPSTDGKMYVISNTSGQTITVKTASSTGITIATAKTATIIYMGTDFIKIGEV